MKTISQRAQIVVVGGGLAGICAAISASRNGASVHLIESRFALGGRIGEEIRLPMDLPNSCNFRYFREGGLLNEISLFLLKNNEEGTYAGLSRALTTLILAEERIQLHLGIQVIEASVNRRGDSIESCLGICLSSGRRFLYKADYYIDCTGSGSFSTLAGAPGEKAINIPGDPHLKTPVIFKRSVALVKVIAQPETVPFQCPSWVKLKWEDNHYEAKAEWLESLNRSIVGYHHIEWVQQQSSSSINAYEIAWSAWDFIKNRSNLKGAAKTLAIECISPVLFSQSNFRGLGDYVLSLEDVTEGKTFEDSIALGRSPMDKGMTLLSSTRGKYALAQPFEIPLRSLYSNKIRNLLWAGEHASVSHEVAPCLSFPPTAAQLGVATGHIAAHCIAKSRQPRTIAKKGHVDELRKSLELIDHRTGLVQFNDDTDLVCSALVKSSSFWNEDDIPSLATRMGPAVKACMFQFPLQEHSIEEIKFVLSSEEPLELEARLLSGTCFEGNIPGACLDSCSFEKQQTGPEEISLAFDLQVVSPGWHYLEIKSHKKFVVHEVESPPVGWLTLYPQQKNHCKTSNSYLDYYVQAGYDKPTTGPLMEVLPRQKKLYSAQNVASHPVRPTDLPHLWVSKPSDFKYPEFLEFFWDDPVSISSITIHFDPAYELPFPPFPSLGLPQNFDALVKDYKIYTVSPSGKSSLLLEIYGNFLSRRTHAFNSIEISGLEIEILATNGLNRAQIFRIQAFA